MSLTIYEFIMSNKIIKKSILLRNMYICQVKYKNKPEKIHIEIRIGFLLGNMR